MKIVSDTEYISKDAFVAQQRKQYCENCERRKGTKNGKWIFVYEVGGAPCRACDIEDMIDAVCDFSPADVAPVVHGRWNPYHWQNALGAVIEGYQCSECGEGISYNEWGDYHFSEYCPECGAKMDEEAENEV